MQQTPNYNLNKPETGDMFSPQPLNQNMDTVDQVLARLDGASADLTQRMVALEGCRVVVGWYKGNGASNEVGMTIDLGERPAAVLSMITITANAYFGLAVGDKTCTGSSSSVVSLKLVDNGFWVSNRLNANNTIYCYLAFLGGWPRQDFPGT